MEGELSHFFSLALINRGAHIITKTQKTQHTPVLAAAQHLRLAEEQAARLLKGAAAAAAVRPEHLDGDGLCARVKVAAVHARESAFADFGLELQPVAVVPGVVLIRLHVALPREGVALLMLLLLLPGRVVVRCGCYSGLAARHLVRARDGGVGPPPGGNVPQFSSLLSS